jgi:hypothetical protein
MWHRGHGGLDAVTDQEAAQEDAQEEASQDAEEDALATSSTGKMITVP